MRKREEKEKGQYDNYIHSGSTLINKEKKEKKKKRREISNYTNELIN